jgi:signal transduction histidine kinase
LDPTNAPGPQHPAELVEQVRVVNDERLVKRFAKLAKALSYVVALTGSAALIGYVADIQWLVTVRPGLQAMSPVTAVGLIALAAANLTQDRVLAWSMTVVACAITLTTLIANLVIGTDVISLVVSRWVSQAGLPPTALTSDATAFCLGLLAAARGLKLRRRDNAGEICAATALLIAGLGATGYLYDAKGLYAIYPFQTMALHTALCLVFLAAAFLMSSLGGWMAVVVSSSRAGSVTRRQLLLAATLPVIGWLLIYCIDRQLMGPSSAIALVVILMFSPLVILIVRDGTILTKYDEKQLATELFENNMRARLQSELAAKVLELEHESAQRKAVEDSMHRAQRLEAIGQLTGGIAHDFNNLLMGISGNLELTKRKLPQDSSALNNVARASQATEKGINLTAHCWPFPGHSGSMCKPWS